MLKIWTYTNWFPHYASHEGKKTSKAIGSIVKSALKRGMFKHPEIKIHNDDAVINTIRYEVKERTKQFYFFIVEKSDSFERTPNQERGALEIQEFNSCIV